MTRRELQRSCRKPWSNAVLQSFGIDLIQPSPGRMANLFPASSKK
jgi:hypothetical protein